MGFFTGRVTFSRFRVTGRSLQSFSGDHLEQLQANAIGKQRIAAGDGSQAGWIAGDHILDTRFNLEKNVVNDSLQFGMRVDEIKIPGDLLRAYMQVELDALAAQNPSGLPSNRQKKEARQLAKDRLENEAKDGKYLRRKYIPLLWDAPSGELLVGTTSISIIDRLLTLFHQTFDRKLESLGSGKQAYLLAEPNGTTRQIDDAAPTVFVPSQAHEVAWIPDETNRDFLGNEFLLWLWYVLENESDEISLSDDSKVAVMIARSLVLECPRGQNGKQSITSDGPTKLPEAKRAIQAGKLPRKAGLTIVRHDHPYEFTLQAESLAVSGARLPAPEEEEERTRLEERVSQIRHLIETMDLLFNAFLQRRLGDAWTKESGHLKKWLKGSE